MSTAPYMETEFVNTDIKNDIDKRTTRWIVFSGDRFTPEAKRNFDGMTMGGENLGHDYKTLAPSKHLLRRCQLTPMIVGHDDLNADTLGDDKTRVKSRGAYDAETRTNYTIYYNECLPGDELDSLLSNCQGIFDYGIREVEALRGVEPPRKDRNGNLTSSKAIDYQYSIFPDWNKYLSGELEFFPTTTALSSYLQKRSAEIENAEIRAVIATLLESNAQFERWATAKLSAQANLVKAPPTPEGRVYGWEAIHVQYFEMLELNREEFLMKKSGDAQPTNEVSAADFAEMREMMKVAMPAIAQLANIAVANSPKTKAVCTAFKADETPCKAFTREGSDFCAAHEPKTVAV